MQDIMKHIVRASAILTNAYVAGTIIEDVGHKNQLIIIVDFTKGSLDSASIKIEFGYLNLKGTPSYTQETFENVTGGVATETLGTHIFSATGIYRIAVPLKDHTVKISAIGTGTVTDSLMAISAISGVS
jgi:hypothetical protein